MATFMAKWSHDHPGQSGHIHLSLRDRKTGRSAFFDESRPHGMSATQSSFMAGVQRYLPEFMALYAQTVNSYSRLVPGSWAPLDATWGMENRTTALRLIPGSDKSRRVPVRIGSADANPYLALAAALASGLHGIEQGLEPEPMVQGNAYTQQFPGHLRLPSTLWEAAQRLRASEAARQLFGDAFVEHYVATREWEERRFRRHVTDWELARYFEIVSPHPPACARQPRPELITISPIDGREVVRRPYASEAQIAQALADAQAAQPDWQALGVQARGRIVSDAVDRFVAWKDDIARAITVQMGRRCATRRARSRASRRARAT